MKLFRIITAFAIGGIATSSYLAIAIPPIMVPQVAVAKIAVVEVIKTATDMDVMAPEASEETLTPQSSIQAKIVAYASKYGVSEVLVRDLVSCETGGSFDPDIQSSAIYEFSRSAQGIEVGGRERSYGLAQIHLPDNPNISLAQAKDPDYALDFMARELAADNAWRWKICFDSVGGSVYSAPVH